MPIVGHKSCSLPVILTFFFLAKIVGDQCYVLFCEEEEEGLQSRPDLKP